MDGTASSFCHRVMDSRNPHALARFWSAMLDRPIAYETDEEVIVGVGKNTYPGLEALNPLFSRN